MKLAPKTIASISKKLKKVASIIDVNNGSQIEDIKDELYDIIQEIDEENHRCFTSHDAWTSLRTANFILFFHHSN